MTGDKGVEPAMEWLLAHADDLVMAPECVSADSTNTTEPNSGGAEAGDAAIAAGASSSSTESTSEEVKSFKCEEW